MVQTDLIMFTLRDEIHSCLKIKYFASREFQFAAFDVSSKNNFMIESECLDATATLQPSLSRRTDLVLVSLRYGKGPWPTFAKSASMAAVFDKSVS